MNKFDEALERIQKNLEIQDGWSDEDIDHYQTIVFALKIASDLWEDYNPKAEPNNVECIDCEYLMFSDCYGECAKAYKGIVSPHDSCGKGKKKGGEW